MESLMLKFAEVVSRTRTAVGAIGGRIELQLQESWMGAWLCLHSGPWFF